MVFTHNIMTHQYLITCNYKDSDNIVFTLTDNRVEIGLNHLLIDLATEGANTVQFFATVPITRLQALLPNITIVQEY